MQITGNGIQLNLENLAKTEAETTEKLMSVLKNVSNADGSDSLLSLALMEPGTCFQGKVLEIADNRALIGMQNGEQFTARLANGITMELNRNILFEVKSNENGAVSVRPVSLESAVDMTATKALTAAGMSLTEKNLAIASGLLEEKMPVNRQNIQKLLRDTSICPKTPVKSLVLMEKAGILVTPENAAQFVKYQEGRHYLETEMDLLSEGFFQETEQLAGQGQIKEAADMNLRLLEYVLDGFENTEKQVESQTGEVKNSEDGNGLIAEGESEKMSEPALDERAETPVLTALGEKAEELRDLIREMEKAETGENIKETEKNVKEQPAEQPEKLPEREIFEEVKEFLSKTDYKKLIKNALKDNILLQPEEVSKEEVEKIYQRIQREVRVLHQTVEDTGLLESRVEKQAGSLEENLDFMQQLNQMYTYVQLPLKMAGKNAHGDLYVFADKKSLKEEKEELSALLHLDMEELGAMDIFVTLREKQVGTRITLESEEILELFEKHIHILTEQLQKKGYSLDTVLETGEAKPDFVQDFLFKGEKGADFQQFSFDVKA